MRLATYVADGGARLGAVVGPEGSEVVIDVASLGPGLPSTMTDLLEREVGPQLDAIRASIDGREHPGMQLRDVRLLAPVPRPGKIVAVGRNYREHAAEEGAAVLPDPVLFTKYSSSITGPDSEIRWRASASTQVDHEAELAVVIGRRTRDTPEDSALEAVLGYTCLNDVSARDLQAQDGQWVRGKSLDTFCPMGPWLVTGDDVPDPQRLTIRCTVDGIVRQEASTSEMIHSVAGLVSFCSRYFTLEPGDIIATGTPGGVGAFREPPVFLGDGDRVVVEIEGIGRLENRCRVIADP